MKSVLLYGSETWRTTQATLHKLQTFFNSCPREILCIRCPEKIRNEDPWKTAKSRTRGRTGPQKKVGLGRLHPQEASKQQHQAVSDLESTGEEKGRPINTWRRDAEVDMLRSGDCWKKLEKTAQSRVRWRSVVHGLCSS